MRRLFEYASCQEQKNLKRITLEANGFCTQLGPCVGHLPEHNAADYYPLGLSVMSYPLLEVHRVCLQNPSQTIGLRQCG